MVGMRMGDDSALHRAPGIDVEIATRAVKTFTPQYDQIMAWRVRHG
jgi:hypothetical protein